MEKKYNYSPSEIKNGLTAKITNYGGILTSFTLPLPNEERENRAGF